MQQIGLWHIPNDNSAPTRVNTATLALEAHLERWIEENPDLVEPGLKVVGRQIDLGEGGRLDLLALDQEGWVVIEIKRETLYREALAQAIDYASSVAALPPEELARKVEPYIAQHYGDERSQINALGGLDDEEGQRKVRMVVVGTGNAPGLERIIDYLAQNLQIRVVLFQVFQLQDGDRVLVREIRERAEDITPDRKYKVRSVEELQAVARGKGIGDEFDLILGTARKLGLYPRCWKNCLMFTSPKNKLKTLFTVWADFPRDGKIMVYISTSAFPGFYEVTEEEVRSILIWDQYTYLDSAEAHEFVSRLDRLFGVIQAKAAPGEAETTEI